jgi:hypothetical protein
VTVGGPDDQQKRGSRSAVEDWLASQIAAHLGVPDEEEERETELADEHEPEDVRVDVNDVGTEPLRTTEISHGHGPVHESPPAPPSVPPSRAPTLPPARHARTHSPRPPLPRARHTSDLDGTDPDISDPRGRPLPVEPELEDLEIVADLADQSTVLRPPPPPTRRATHTPPPRPASPLSDAPTASPLSDGPTVVRRTASIPPPPPPADDGDAFSDMLDGWTGAALALLLFGAVVILAVLLFMRYAGTS